MAQEFVHKVPRYTADQFTGQPPLPPNVVSDGNGGFHLQTGGPPMPIRATDWILADTVTRGQTVVSDACFKQDYVVATGPA